jgi:hypothetical protein
LRPTLNNQITGGMLLQDGEAIADVATIRWTFADGRQMAWTGWLTLADNAKPVAAGRFTLELTDGGSGPVLLMAQAAPGCPAPFCHAPPLPRCKPAGC